MHKTEVFTAFFSKNDFETNQHVVHDINRRKVSNFVKKLFGVIFWLFLGHSGVFGVNKKSPEITTNTNRTKLNLCELNSMGNTLKVKYKFGALQML